MSSCLRRQGKPTHESGNLGEHIANTAASIVQVIDLNAIDKVFLLLFKVYFPFYFNLVQQLLIRIQFFNVYC